MISGRRTYRRHLPHFQSDFRTYFIFSTQNRWILPPSARAIAVRHIVFEDGRRVHLHAAVVMPDHVHILITPMYDSAGHNYALPTILQGIKGSSARSINKALRRSGTVWQEESFDHELRRDESLRVKAAYLCANPVRKGLVASIDDYPWLWREWIDRVRTA